MTGEGQGLCDDRWGFKSHVFSVAAGLRDALIADAGGPAGVGGAAAAVAGASRKLGKNLIRSGASRKPGEHAHHIVAHGEPDAAQIRGILEKFGIDINSAENGVFLPGYKKSPNPFGAAVHLSTNTGPYYKSVNAMLNKATNRSEAAATLDYLRGRLLSGPWP